MGVIITRIAQRPWDSPPGSRVWRLNTLACLNCGWSAEEAGEVGWPLATEEFLRAKPRCPECKTQLSADIERLEELVR